MIYEDFDGGEKSYFNSLSKFKTLSKKEEKSLLTRYKKFNDLSARNTLINSNLKYACKIASVYRGRGLMYRELISEANRGLIDSLDKFDISKDVKLISYSKWWIMQRIQSAIERRNRMPTAELPENTDMVDDDNEDEDVYREPSNKFEQSFEIVSDDEDNEAENSKLIEKIFSNLDEREEDMINMYYGRLYAQPFTLEEIGEKYNLTKERVRQVIEKAFKKVRSEAILLDNVYISGKN